MEFGVGGVGMHLWRGFWGDAWSGGVVCICGVDFGVILGTGGGGGGLVCVCDEAWRGVRMHLWCGVGGGV